MDIITHKNSPLIDIKELGLLLFIFVVIHFGNPGVIAAFGLILLLMPIRREWLLKGLLYAFFIRFTNPRLLTFGVSYITIFSWLILLVALVLSSYHFFRQRNRLQSSLVFFLIFAGYLLFNSIVISPHPQISTFKTIAFIAGFLAVYFSISVSQKYNWERFKFNVGTFYIMASLPFYVVRSIGYARNRISFQGITNHPQFFGMILALLLAFMVFYVLSVKGPGFSGILPKLVIVIGFFELLSTDTRTGIFAFFLGVLLLLFTYYVGFSFIRKDAVMKIFKSPYMFFALMLVGLVAIFQFDHIATKVENVVHKTARFGDQSTKVGVFASRETAFNCSMDNFYENMAFGIGFGVPSNFEYRKVVTVRGIPISAPVEKGNIVSGLLEETGVTGFFLFSAFVLSVFAQIKNYGRAYHLITFFVAMLINLGEMVFFATGGSGVFIWYMMLMSLGQSQDRSFKASA